MSHMLAEFPSRNTQAGRKPPPHQSRSYQVDELNSAPDRMQNRRYIFRIFVLAPALVCLAIYAIVEMPEIMARTGALLNGASGRSRAVSFSLIAGASEWLPALLVLLSTAVLVCMGFITLRGRSKQFRPRGPELVRNTIQTVATEAAALAKAAASMAAAPGRPFLVARSERRHAAQEAVRLSRDARASAEQRAAAVSRLRIQPASPAFQPLEAPEPVVRFRTLPRHREPARDGKPTTTTSPPETQGGRPVDTPPKATA